MRLLLVQGGFGAGGAEKVVAMLAAHRAALGDEVHVAGFTCPAGGPYFDHPPDVTLHLPPPGSAPARGTPQLRRARHIRSCLVGLRPDLAIAFLTKVNTLTVLAATGLGVPVVISERNNPAAQAQSPLWRPLHALAARRAAALVMQTRRARDELSPRLRRRACVIPNPCAPIARPEAARPPGAGELRLVAVGRLDRQKGFDLLLDALAALRDRHPGLRLTIFGEGPERAALQDRAAALRIADIVRLPGATGRPGAWIGAGDVLVLPSRHEGFPNVVAEATLSGLPVVAFDCAYGPRELIDHGRNGLLVPPGDVAALAEAIARLAQDPGLRARMAAASDLNRERLSVAAVMRLWDGVIHASVAPAGLPQTV